jgi:hypothetical protein
MNIEVPTKCPLSQGRIVVFEIRLHSKSPMLYRPALHGNSNALSLARRALKNKLPTPTVSLTTVLQNRQVFLPDPVYRTFDLPPSLEIMVRRRRRKRKRKKRKKEKCPTVPLSQTSSSACVRTYAQERQDLFNSSFIAIRKRGVNSVKNNP